MTQGKQVYVVRNAETGFYKIGSSGELKKRMVNLQTANSTKLELVLNVEVDNASDVERAMHLHFVSKQVMGEWFNLTGQDIEELYERIITMGKINANTKQAEKSIVTKKTMLTAMRKGKTSKAKTAQEVFKAEIGHKNKEKFKKIVTNGGQTKKVKLTTCNQEFILNSVSKEALHTVELVERVKERYRNRSAALAAAGAFSVFDIPAFASVMLKCGEFFTMTVTPEMAAKILRTHHDGPQGIQRPISRNRVEEYAALMAVGAWNTSVEPIIIDENGFILSGSNRLSAVVRTGQSVTFLFVVNVDSGACQFIDAGRPRSPSDRICRPGTAGKKLSRCARFFYRLAYPSSGSRCQAFTLEHLCSILEPYHNEAMETAFKDKLYKQVAVVSAYVYKLMTAKSVLEQHKIKELWEVLNLNKGRYTPVMGSLRSSLEQNAPSVFEVSRKNFLHTLTALSPEFQSRFGDLALDQFNSAKVEKTLKGLFAVEQQTDSVAVAS
jgi:hypothetical protein